MNNRDQILALTRLAFLNAIFLAAMSVQFVIPPLFLIFLWLLPALFAIQAYYAPMRLVALSAFMVALLSFSLLGFTGGLWSLVYAWVGVALAVSWRRGQWGRRILVTGLALFAALLAAIVIMAWLVQVTWLDAVAIAARLSLMPPDRLLPAAIVALFIWSLILAGLLNWVFWRLQTHLDIGA